MVTETHRRLALELRLTGETLIAAPAPGSYNTLSKMLAALSRAGLTGSALDNANSTMSDVVDRFERVGKVGLKETEAAALRQALAGLDACLWRLPVNKLTEAIVAVEIYCADIGA